MNLNLLVRNDLSNDLSLYNDLTNDLYQTPMYASAAPYDQVVNLQYFILYLLLYLL